MNDLTILHDAWDAPEAPSHASHARARAHLSAHIDRRRRAPRVRVRLAAVDALALAIATCSRPSSRRRSSAR